MVTNKMTTEEMLKSCVETQPKTLLNIGVGPVPHSEAKTFRKLWPTMRIVGLEPSPDTFAKRISDYPGELYPWALWSIPCDKVFNAMKLLSGQSSFLDFEVTKSRPCKKILVSCITLDQLDETLKFPEDIFLWMDIEGAELEALKGGHKLLESGRVKLVNLEVSIQPIRVGEPSEDDLSSYLKQYGFSICLRYDIGTHFQNTVWSK